MRQYTWANWREQPLVSEYTLNVVKQPATQHQHTARLAKNMPVTQEEVSKVNRSPRRRRHCAFTDWMIVKPSPLTRVPFSSLHSRWLTAAETQLKSCWRKGDWGGVLFTSVLSKTAKPYTLKSLLPFAVENKMAAINTSGHWRWKSQQMTILVTSKVTFIMQYKGNSKHVKWKRQFCTHNKWCTEAECLPESRC